MVAAGEAAPLRAREDDAGGEEAVASRDGGRTHACYEASEACVLLGALAAPAPAATGDPRRSRRMLNAAMTSATLVSRRKRRSSQPHRPHRQNKKRDIVLKQRFQATTLLLLPVDDETRRSATHSFNQNSRTVKEFPGYPSRTPPWLPRI